MKKRKVKVFLLGNINIYFPVVGEKSNEVYKEFEKIYATEESDPLVIIVSPGNPMRLVPRSKILNYYQCCESSIESENFQDTDLIMDYDCRFMIPQGDVRYLIGDVVLYAQDEFENLVTFPMEQLDKVEEILEKCTVRLSNGNGEFLAFQI